ncbi:MAG TPA: hypothetical protein VMY77_06270 [Chitinophagaceae bacterium]|nr:hypothetical protein [Chitinophagaceae bacterium]
MSEVKTKIIKYRPLSKTMIEALMDCHERELLNLEPYDVCSIKYSTKALIDRGLLETKDIITGKGKRILAVFVTNLGITILNSL